MVSFLWRETRLRGRGDCGTELPWIAEEARSEWVPLLVTGGAHVVETLLLRASIPHFALRMREST
jgi:hypothetical protein